MQKFYTKSGWLTAHGMACGYIHQLEDRDLSLYHITGTIYQVTVRRESDFTNGFDWRDWDSNSIVYTKCFDGINEARQVYRKISKTRQLPKRYESGANRMVYT